MANKKNSGGKGHLASLDMTKTIKKKKYHHKLGKLQEELRQIQQAYLFSGDAAVLVFEGWDAAGKGGTIRRMMALLDPRGVKVWPIAAPRDYYRERHYLTRFWERLPPKGTISIFDRSWYGRVMVERVEGFATTTEWQRAFDEINDFERLLVEDGTRVLKFFLHITPEEQLRRFEERLRDPIKRWKLGYEDFRNRKRWPEYIEAIEEMLDKTSTRIAPWHLVPANDKRYARIEIISTICQKLAKDVELGPRPLDQKTLLEANNIFDLDPDLVANLAGRTE
ncbi:polyphosphate kinase 2 (PPK2 family) [Rhodobium orientis]|uniref:Polyphosphate kinase n=1 Tax=Rhodobium orientis TaxID=34017 RepID=A0A327JWY4_9HYPH|nr:polyphosphate kinase [Rhodobium orientis]MBB4301152.1 polyphosphate kinase 2 (PPK2 family) [Rhodobium orientis]MBK5949837.1 polyphosphate kinase [Rhodobium orientis]RAI30075.1 polyphosphate kinase [Rhodobium orientis]